MTVVQATRPWWGSGINPGLTCSCSRQKEQLSLQCKVSSVKNRGQSHGRSRTSTSWNILAPEIFQRQLMTVLALLETHEFGSGAVSVYAFVGTS